MKIIAADVAVVGVGTAGSAALWRLAERGVRVVGIEQFSPGHDRGSGHGESRIIRTAYHEGADYIPLVRAAFGYWRALEHRAGVSLLTMTGALNIGSADGSVVRGALEAAAAHDLPHELLDSDALTRRFPQHRALPEDIAVWEGEAGVLRPELSITSACEVAQRLGAEILTQRRVIGFEPGPGGSVDVRLTDRVVRARHAVVTAGAWIPGLVPDANLPLTVERKVLGWFPATDVEAHSPYRFPVFIRQSPEAHWYGFPSLDGQTVKFGIHLGGQKTNADELNRDVTADDTRPLAQLASRYLPGLDPHPARTAVCMYTNTPDGHFLIGPLAGWDNVTVVSACSGHGFKFAPVLGEIAAQLALHGGTTLPIGRFDPTRFSTMAEQRAAP